jgi:hypothetical protein
MRILVRLLLFCAFMGLAAPALAQPLPMTTQVCGPSETSPCRPIGAEPLDPQGRELWLTAQVNLPEHRAPTPLGVNVSGTAASQVYWNGTLVGSNGLPASSKALERPGDIDFHVIVPPALVRPGANTLRVHMSGFNAVGQFKHPVDVWASSYGPESGMFVRGQWWRLRFFVPALLALGALVVSITYFGSLWALDRSDRGSGLLALLCLAAVGQLLSEVYRGLFGYLYPYHLTRVVLIAAFAGVFGILLTAFAAERFAPTVRRRVTAVTAGLVLIGALVMQGYDSKATISFIITGLIAGGLAAKGVIDKRPGALAALAGIGVFLATLLAGSQVFLDQGYYLALSVLMLMLFVAQVIALRRREREAEALRSQATRLELELLKRQLTPHVLLNTLTSLSEWIHADPKAGMRMIDALASELRALSHVSGKRLITIGEELELCRAHLALMSIQRDTPFSLTTEGVDEAALIPPAVFHTVIENALTHNRYADGAAFVLRRTPEGYEITAPPGDDLAVRGEGHGAAYIRGRLNEAFGDRWRFASNATADGGWTTIIEMAG